MTDCPNAEMRDRLPDLLHARLDASARAAVLAHVEGCADCSAELALLRQMRVSLSSGAVSVDAEAIAQAVVARVASSTRPVRWTDWRLAAAIAVIVVGGASLVTIRARNGPNDGVRPVPVRTAAAAPGAESVHVASQMPSAPANVPPRRAVQPAAAELSASGDVADLDESALRTLLNDLDTLQAVPPTEPEPVTVRVSLPESGGVE